MNDITVDGSARTTSRAVEVPAMARRQWTRQFVLAALVSYAIISIAIMLLLIVCGVPITGVSIIGIPSGGLFWAVFVWPQLTRDLDSIRFSRWNRTTEELIAPAKLALSETRLPLRDIRISKNGFDIVFVEANHIEPLTVSFVKWVECPTPYVRFTSPTDDATESLQWSEYHHRTPKDHPVSVTVRRGTLVEIGVPDPTDPATWPRSLH